MSHRDIPLPAAFEVLLGKDHDEWPREAALITAAYSGNVRRVKEIAKIVDVDGKGIPATVANTAFFGLNALHAACDLGDLLMLSYLVEGLNMDVNKPDTSRGFTPLEHAVCNGKLPAVRFLLDHGANLHYKRMNVSLLHSAVEKGQAEIAKFLLSRGASIDIESSFMSPLHLASYRGYADIMKVLLVHNADPNKVMASNFPFPPLEMALKSSSVPCLKLLVQAGADVNGYGSFNPLARAAEKGLTEATKCLLEAGANPNVPDTFGRLPIELAAEYGTWEDVEILFPSTSPIPTVADWSVHGIISHVYMEVMQLEDDDFVKKRKADLKRQAGVAFKRQDYQSASELYTQALKVDRFDATLFSNRSLCWLRLNDGLKAIDDAVQCKELRPKWAKAHYRQGAALMHLKEYEQAYNVLSSGLELDPESEEMETLFWEAMELK